MSLLNLARKPARLSVGRKVINAEVYGTYFPTYSERINWVKKNKPRETWNRWFLLVEREHLLDLREVYPEKRELIGNQLRKMPKTGCNVLGALR